MAPHQKPLPIPPHPPLNNRFTPHTDNPPTTSAAPTIIGHFPNPISFAGSSFVSITVYPPAGLNLLCSKLTRTGPGNPPTAVIPVKLFSSTCSVGRGRSSSLTCT